mmetsp:Transcript_35498/g.99710  ORF Transcript_35498/g.99710 Transcript_35498/m.99710 type:complete len:304 (+) Transcript_35498:166-1077(+)
MREQRASVVPLERRALRTRWTSQDTTAHSRPLGAPAHARGPLRIIAPPRGLHSSPWPCLTSWKASERTTSIPGSSHDTALLRWSPDWSRKTCPRYESCERAAPAGRTASLVQAPVWGCSHIRSASPWYLLAKVTLHSDPRAGAPGAAPPSQPWRSSAGWPSTQAAAGPRGLILIHLFADHFVRPPPTGHPAWRAFLSPRPLGWKLYHRITVPCRGNTFRPLSQEVMFGSGACGQARVSRPPRSLSGLHIGWPCLGNTVSPPCSTSLRYQNKVAMRSWCPKWLPNHADTWSGYSSSSAQSMWAW